MKFKCRKLLLASSITLALASASGAAFADTSTDDVTQARQETQIWTTYSLSPYLRANDLQVSVDDGSDTTKALASNMAANTRGAERALAIELAKNIRGVKSVNATALTI